MTLARKAQLSWFVVLGIVFLVIIMIVSWLAYSTQFLKAKPGQVMSSEEEVKNVKSYLESCEQELAEEALITIGNQGGKITPETYFELGKNKIEISYDEEVTLPSLEEINKDLASYINKNVVRKCNPETATKKEVTTSKPQTRVSFNDKEAIVEIAWPVTMTFENNTKHSIDTIKFSLPVRIKLLHETITQDLEIPGQTDLNLMNSLDKIDMKKISYQDITLKIVIDHKSKIKNKPYKFFYATA